MTHPSFTYEHPLPSLRVTKDFLASLEQYLLKRVVDSALVSTEEAQASLVIKVNDSFGSEKLNSISQFDASRFSDSTTQIEIELGSPYRRDGMRLKIRLNFARGRLFSTVAISATTPNARDFVLGLKDGIMRVVDPQRTWHWVCHPNAQGWGAFIGIGAILGVSLFRLDAKDILYPFSLGAFAFVFLYLSQLSSLRPYTVFDSRASERSDKIWSWLIGGLGTFLLFGTLLTFIRRPLLGF